jgi:succinate dehydrogenase/fumarate reductase flavoprotein subunit
MVRSTAFRKSGHDKMSMNKSLLECDLLVAGSGAAGLAAAVTAAAEGLSVIVAEKAPVFGGTTCFSAGLVWIPCNLAARDIGIEDSREAALDYLRAEAGNRLDQDKAQVFVETAAEILDWFEHNSHVAFALVPAWPDYHPESPGGSAGGRSLGPVPFDGRRLGSRFADLRPPLSTTTILGGMMVGREDLVHFYGMQRSLGSAMKVGRLFARYARDRLTYPRGTRLSNGAALIGMLALSAIERGVRIELGSPISRLLFENDRAAGAVLATATGEIEVRARRGVVLATGGFPANPDLRARVSDTIAAATTHRSLAPDENRGEGIMLAEELGAGFIANLKHPAAWSPVSLVPNADGTTTPFPHFFDRGKAGYIAVNRQGRRFTNEANSYHDFVPAMAEACRAEDGSIECFLVTDAASIRRYGLGMAPPFPGRLGRHLASGYIIRANSLAELARVCGIDPAGLQATIATWNPFAARGEDPEFGKGSNVYQRFNGSAGVSPNPCVAPIAKAPFYAIRLVPGDIGTFAGLRTDPDSCVLDTEGEPISGLYAVGNDAASFMGGSYPGAGITIGPALVFGHRAAKHAARSG